MLATRASVQVDCVWNVMAHAQKPDFAFRGNVRVHLNRQGVQFSRLLAGELQASACRVCTTRASLCSAVMWRLLVTHSILLFPLHFSAPASPCAITFQTQSTKTLITNTIFLTSQNALRFATTKVSQWQSSTAGFVGKGHTPSLRQPSAPISWIAH
jgi:hypothetical protein